MRLIDADAAIEALNTQAEEMSHWSERYQEQRRGVLTAVNIVADCPSVQPERKTGRWIYRKELSRYSDMWSCSECNEKTTDSIMGKPRPNFCPLCGADMRGEENEYGKTEETN